MTSEAGGTTVSIDLNTVKPVVHHQECTRLEQEGYVAEPHGIATRKRSPIERSLLRKADLVILPLAALSYLVAYLDRNSLGNGRIMGLQVTLHLSNQQFYNCLLMLYIGYIIFMLPPTILLRVIPPNMVIGGAIILFGFCVAIMSTVKSYGSIIALRLIIGACNSCVGCIGTYTSLWYKRDEVASRGAVYYSAATISGAFAGLISYGIQKDLAGSLGKMAWQWLFIIEGAMAIFVGIFVWDFLPPFPDKIKGGKHWLFSSAEIELAVNRSKEYNVQGAKVHTRQIWLALKDFKFWMWAITNSSFGLGIAALGSFLPTFIRELGFSPVRAQLFSVIPYGAATVMLLVLCFASDRLNRKAPFLLFALAMGIVGCIILIAVKSVPAKIFAASLVASAMYPGVVLMVSWLNINTAGFTKRASTWAFIEVLGQCFAITATQIYDTPPLFVKGHSIVLGFLVAGFISTIAVWWHMRRQNIKRDEIAQQYAGRGETNPDAFKTLEELQDNHPNFRYIL